MKTSAASGVFRSVKAGTNNGVLLAFQSTRRPPANIPFLVDNLWEWRRPPGFACRRHAVYAHPSLSAAQEYGPATNEVYKVVLHGSFRLCQLPGFADSREHPDCRNLPRLLLAELGQSWLDSPLDPDKRNAGLLWAPCLSADEVEHLFQVVPSLQRIREPVAQAISYWDDVVRVRSLDEILDGVGEVFFEPLDGYELRPVNPE